MFGVISILVAFCNCISPALVAFDLSIFVNSSYTGGIPLGIFKPFWVVVLTSSPGIHSP